LTTNPFGYYRFGCFRRPEYVSKCFQQVVHLPRSSRVIQVDDELTDLDSSDRGLEL